MEDVSITNEDVWTPGAVLVFVFGHQEQKFYFKSLNPPKIKTIKLPEYIMLGYMLYPRLIIEHGSREYSKFTWFRQVVCCASDEATQEGTEGMYIKFTKCVKC